MTQKKVTTFVVIAILVVGLVYLLGGEGADRDLVQSLKQQSGEPPLAHDATTVGQEDKSQWLTPETLLRNSPSGSIWTVESPKTSDVNTRVRFPFDPRVGATSPRDEAGGDSATNKNPGFLGAEACAECHRENHSGFVDTGHHQTSGPITPDYARGSFESPDNVLQTTDAALTYTMDRSDKQIVQKVALADWSHKVQMDVVVGSAKVGQSFLYWNDDALYQSCVSYLTQSDGWIPSPGYADNEANFTRPIRTACLECHVTYIERIERPNHYDHESVIWGISCERCHGPGKEHVEYHRTHPKEKKSKHIIYPKDLSRERQLDICGQCHSGGFALRRPAFTYRPGDDLSEFHKHMQPDTGSVGGIHTSNQLTRLKKSRCFHQSEMTCTTCHDPHKNQRGDTAAFTTSCLGCHQSEHCGMATDIGPEISNDCVSCHMPISVNEDMTGVGDGKMKMLMVDHYIRIDAEATHSYLAK